MGVAIVCACLPTLAPALPAIAKPFSQLRNWSSLIWSRLIGPSRTAAVGTQHLKSSEEYDLPASPDKWPGQTPLTARTEECYVQIR